MTFTAGNKAIRYHLDNREDLHLFEKVIIMDEPTASISVQAIAELLDLVKELKQHGVSQILISHRLEDIMKVADRVMVLRRGQRVDVCPISEVCLEDIIHLMVRGKEGTILAAEAV